MCLSEALKFENNSEIIQLMSNIKEESEKKLRNNKKIITLNKEKWTIFIYLSLYQSSNPTYFEYSPPASYKINIISYPHPTPFYNINIIN